MTTVSTTNSNATLRAALEYAALGWPVLPLHSIRNGACTCGKANCSSPGKHPLTEHGLKDASIDTSIIREWWARWPDANVGIATGAGSRIIVLDVDPAHGGGGSLEDLERDHGRLPDTVEVLTGGGGRHYYFAHPGGHVKGDNRGKVGVGLDIKAEGGYVVAPPSLHASGKQYVWEYSSDPSTAPLAPPPAWLLDKLRPAPRQAPAPRVDGLVIEGRRNDALTSRAGTMRRSGMSQVCIEAALLVENQATCSPPLEESEVLAIARSVAKYPPAGERHLTDTGNAERFAAMHGGDVRFNCTLGKWLVWTGWRWEIDTTGDVQQRAKATARSYLVDAAEEANAEKREALIKHVRGSDSNRGIKAMLERAQSEGHLPIRAEQLDRDPWALNVLNGVLDLRTGTLRPHRREDYLTLLAPVEYHAEAHSDLWELVLHDATGGDTDVAAFLQRAIGYSLTGDTGEDRLFFVHGPTKTGKSTILEAVKATLGEYASTADFETFLARSQVGGPRNDIARLAGKRFVLSIEVDEGKRLAEGLVKMLTGGDTVAARFLYGEAFEFRPQFKLWLAANHAPKVRDDDDALWERILRVPFTHAIPKGKRDASIKADLRDPSKHGAAILAWAVNGCVAWQRDRLGVPRVVEDATQAYRLDMDPIKDFLADGCIVAPELTSTRGRLRTAYEDWCKANGEHPIQAKDFNARLAGLGCTECWHLGKRAWRGIGLQAPEDAQ